MAARLLIIDNDAYMRQVHTICLHDAGWDVLSYGYSDINLTLLQQLLPDLVILNFTKQNGGEGWQFLQLLKMEETTTHIPIVITTAVFPLAAEMRGYLLARYIQIVYQPFDLDELVQLIRRTLLLASQSSTLAPSVRSLPILVVDDTEELRDATTEILLLEGYLAVPVENGLAALEAIAQTDHCLILLDIVMPVMNGFEFLKLYNQQLRPHTPVIILSGEDNIKTRIVPSFVIDILVKPFLIKQLLQLVERHTRAV